MICEVFRNYTTVVSKNIFSLFCVHMVMGEGFFSYLNGEKFEKIEDARAWIKQYA